MRLALWSVVGCAACMSTQPFPPVPEPLAYTATLAWSVNDAPTVLEVTIDGVPIGSGYQIDRSFATLADAMASSDAVVVETTIGTFPLQMTPTACGGSPRCAEGNGQTCGDLVSETEHWIFYQRTPTTPVVLESNTGSCTFTDGASDLWVAGRRQPAVGPGVAVEPGVQHLER